MRIAPDFHLTVRLQLNTLSVTSSGEVSQAVLPSTPHRTCKVSCAGVVGKIFTPAPSVHRSFFAKQELRLLWQLVSATQRPVVDGGT